jgi:hypothetical protein
VIALDVTDESLTDSDGIRYSITVPDTGNNNPSYIWVQPTNCPDDAATEIDIELRVECENDGNVVIATGTLEDVVNDLRTNEGEPLRCSSGENARCFEPGETVDLVLEVTSSNVDTEINITFEFYAEQCRYNTGTSTPFDSLSSCNGITTQTVNAISWIAFCSEDGNSLNPSITDINSSDSDGPISVDWSTTADVDYVAAKSGQNFTVYDYSDSSTTDGTVTTGGDSDAEYYSSDPPDNVSSTPCKLAEKVGGSLSDIETSVKLNYEGDGFVAEDIGGNGDTAKRDKKRKAKGDKKGSRRGSNKNFDPAEVTHSQ